MVSLPCRVVNEIAEYLSDCSARTNCLFSVYGVWLIAPLGTEGTGVVSGEKWIWGATSSGPLIGIAVTRELSRKSGLFERNSKVAY